MKLLLLLALLFPSEQVTSHLQTGQYAWTSTYEIGYWDSVIHVDLDLHITGPFYDNWLYADDYWDRPGYDIEIDFFSTDPDYYVRSDPNIVRSNMLNWDTDQNFRLIAHEVGHMFGLYDEYSGGAVDPVTGLLSTGLMGNLRGGMYDRYYDPFDTWLDGKLAAATPMATPEPASFLLLGIGLLGLAGGVKRFTPALYPREDSVS